MSYKINLDTVGNGTTIPAAGTYTVEFDEEFNFEAVPDTLNYFKHWDGPYPVPYGESISGEDYRENHSGGIIVNSSEAISTNDDDVETIFDNWINYPNDAGQWEVVDIDGESVIRTTQNTNFTGFLNDIEAGKTNIDVDMGVTEDDDDDAVGLVFRANIYPPDDPENPYSGDITAYDMYYFLMQGNPETSYTQTGLYKLEKAPFPVDSGDHDMWTGGGDGSWNDGILYFVQADDETPTQDTTRYADSDTPPEDAKGAIIPLAETNTTDLTWTALSWYNVQIDAIDDNIKVYVDSNLEIDYTDTDPIISGGYGTFAASQSYASFKNMVAQTEPSDDFEINITANFFDGYDFTVSINDYTYGDVEVRPDSQDLNNVLVTDSPETIKVGPGMEVFLESIPNNAYIFSGWTGDYSISSSEESVVVNQDNTVVECNFEADNVELIVSYEGSGGGLVSHNSGESYEYTADSNVTIEAQAPDTDWSFDGWTNGSYANDIQYLSDPTSLTTDITLVRNMNIVAKYTKETYSLNIEKIGSGSVQPYVGIQNHDKDITVDLLAVPDTGYIFSHWSGPDKDDIVDDSIHMDSNKSITAVFLEDDTFLTLNIDISGSGEIEPGSTVTVPPYSKVDIAAKEIYDSGYEFSHWEGSDNIENIEHKYTTINMGTENESITAVFEPDTSKRILILEINGTGKTNPEPGIYSYDEPTTVLLEAIEEPYTIGNDYSIETKFLHWDGNVKDYSEFITEIDI